MRILFIALYLLLAGFGSAGAQGVKGRIIASNDHLPVSGVSVQIKYTSTKTITDKDGLFTLPAVADTLLISHIGFRPLQISVNGSFLTIQLDRETKELSEVFVSTGYQKLPKERATGSFTLIDNNRYNEQVGTSMLERLRYISNGVTVLPGRAGTSAKDQLIIRGISTMTFSIQKPLIIVDNFEYQGDLGNINPNDIENITFLKDAAAGSIWGAKAANGVIVVTTKKGKYNQKTKVEFVSNFSIIDASDLFYNKSISPSDLINVEQFLFNQKFRFADTASPSRPAFSPVYEILFKRKNGLITAGDSASQIDALRGSDLRRDFEHYLYQKAINQQYALNVRGGSDNMAWILSAGFDRNNSELDALYYRTNIRLDHSYKLTKGLELNTSAYYTDSRSESGKPAYGTIGLLPVYTRLTDDADNPVAVYTEYRQPFIDTVGAGKLLDWRYYPLEDYKHNRTRTSLQDINAVLGINYKPFSFASIDVKYRYEKQDQQTDLLQDRKSYNTRNLINGYSQVDPVSNSVAYKIPLGDILDATNGSLIAQNIRGQINLFQSWRRQEFNAIIGSEVSETKQQSRTSRTYGYNPDVLTYSNVDYTTLYPHFINGADFVPNPARFSKTNTRFASFFGNASYTYNNRYTASISLRRDASNLFGIATNDKWKPLWSTGASWHLSKENFYGVKFLPDLRLRLSYGRQGNIDPSKVSATTISYTTGTTFYGAPYSRVDNFVNPDLRWEQVAMFNAGVDFATKGRRISGSVEWYYKKVTDLYGPSPVDVTTGLGNPTIVKNVGAIQGNGIDLQLRSINLNRTVIWQSDFIFNAYNDKITQYYDPASMKASDLVGSGGGIAGRSSFYLAVYKWAGLDPATGDPQGYLNGQVSKDWAAITGTGGTLEDIRFIGSRLPTIFGSLGNTISWRNFSLTARLTYKFRYYFLRESIEYSKLINTLQGHGDYAKRWQKPGDEQFTTVPSFSYPGNSARDKFYRNSEVLATKGDHIRFQYLNIGYTLDKSSIKNLPVDNIQLYMVVSNLGILWKATKVNVDPDYATIPPAKSYTMGLRVSF